MTAVPCIHIGYPKAASKTLQNGLFEPHSEIECVGKPFKSEKIEHWLASIHAQDTIEFDPEACQRDYDAIVAPLVSGTKSLVVTFELFTLPNHADRGIVAQRLRDLFGEAKIIVNIRSQPDYLQSMYSFQRARAKHSYSFQKYLDEYWDNRVNGFVFHLDYCKLVSTYARLFGRQNIGVFLFEELVHDVEGYARKMCDFVGVDGDEGVRHLAGRHENRGSSAALAAYTRFRKLALPQVRLRDFVSADVADGFKELLNKGPRPKVKVSAARLEAVQERFRAGNQRLAGEYALPLEDYGYPF